MRRGRPRLSLPVLILLAFAGGGDALPAARPVRRGTPLLWRVERDGRTSHLFGTVHLSIDLDTALGPEGRAALEGAKRVFLELDHSLETNATFTRQAIARGGLPEHEALHALLRPDAWNR